MAVVRSEYIKKMQAELGKESTDYSLNVSMGMGCPSKTMIELAAIGAMIDVAKNNNLPEYKTRDLVSNVINEPSCACIANNVIIIMSPSEVLCEMIPLDVKADYIADLNVSEVTVVQNDLYIPTNVLVSLATSEVNVEMIEIEVDLPSKSTTAYLPYSQVNVSTGVITII